MRAMILALAILGCSEAPETGVEVPREVEPSVPSAGSAVVQAPATVACLRVPENVRPAVEAAIAGWRSATVGWRDWRVAEDESPECNLWVLQVGKYANLCSDSAAGCTGELGGLLNATSEMPATVFLYEGEYEAWATGVVMHEIGHTLGLTHEDGTLMQAAWPEDWRKAAWECPDQASLDRLGSGLAGCAMPVTR